MSSWEINLPYRSPAAPVAEIGELAHHLPEAERDVTRHLALLLAGDHGARTVGDALRVVENSGPAERRALHLARTRVGLEDTHTVDAHQRVELASHAARVAATSPWQMCGEPSCNVAPLNNLGAPIAVDVRRWWCERHRDLAQPGDLEPRGSGVRMAPSGALIIEEGEEARAAAEAESRRVLHEDRRAERQVEAVEQAEGERLRAAAFRRELGPGVPG